MATVPDINDTEIWVIDTTLQERYSRKTEVQIADSDIRLSPSDRQTTSCPTIYWREEGCHFMVFKTGENHYRCQFFYKPYKQLGTGISEYDNLTECVVSLLQVQADYAAELRGEGPGSANG